MLRLTIFAHWDKDNQIKSYVVSHLLKLKDVCQDIIFVSTSELSEIEIEKIKHIVKDILVIENKGYDFYMWRCGLEKVNVKNYDELILTNSSIMPIKKLSPMFDYMSSYQGDIWGITSNIEIEFHLQSYFLVFKTKVLHSEHFASFWNGVLPYKNKQQVIRSYEVGLSVYFIDQGYTLDSFIKLNLPYPNLTLSIPLHLINLGMPFVKLELLRANPFRIDLNPIWNEIDILNCRAIATEAIR